jgi:lipid-A-disaccharide synthase
MRYYVIAGEASGDLHGSNLIREMKDLDPQAEFRAWGGDKMEAAGATLVKHFRDLAFMGFAEVLMNLRTIFRNLAFCKEDIAAYQPDALLLIDYPGFNLRIAEWAHAQGMKVIYYISPQVWAWKENRVKKMKQHIDKMLVILPFEKDYYEKKWNWPVSYVGHPLAEVVQQAWNDPRYDPAQLPLNTEDKVIALLPGSRKQEILKKLPVMLEVSRHFPDYRFVVARAPGLDDSFYESLLAAYPSVLAVSGHTYTLLRKAKAALVTSGTATLETALFGVPEVVCYKGNPISYAIARRIITIKYISLVNLIMDKPVVRELIQHDFTVEKVKEALEEIVHNENRRAAMSADYGTLRALLEKGGRASHNAAGEIMAFLRP